MIPSVLMVPSDLREVQGFRVRFLQYANLNPSLIFFLLTCFESVKMIQITKAFDFNNNRLALNLFNEIISTSWITSVAN